MTFISAITTAGIFGSGNTDSAVFRFQRDSPLYCRIPEQAVGWLATEVVPSEPVNPATDTFAWREHLSNLAHDFQLGHRYDRLAMRAVDTRRYAGQPSLTSTEEQTRNGNITQHSREMLGWLWQQVHILAGMSHNDDWQSFRDWLRPWIEGYCACFDARGALDRIHVGHDYLAWEKSLRLHERFIPDFAVYPFGVIRVPDVLPVTDAVSVLDLRNYDNAVDFFGISDADTIRDVWPDGLHSVSDMIQHPVPVPVPSPVNTAQQDLVDYWQEQWFNLRTYTDYSGPAGTRAYRAYVELQLLAVLRNANWSNVDNIRKMDAAKWGAFDYAELSGSENPISAIFANRVDYWFDGYQYFDGTMPWCATRCHTIPPIRSRRRSRRRCRWPIRAYPPTLLWLTGTKSTGRPAAYRQRTRGTCC